ncbi:MAG: RsmB/NOP family class I SAM-dependent RNA methyltransferase [Candidatus Thermoplasmatota archaeon]
MFDGSLIVHESAIKVVAKYLKKGNMSRCLRDILPSSSLSNEQREQVAEIVHDVVRWKNLYDDMIASKGLKKTPEVYVDLAVHGVRDTSGINSFEDQYSCSPYVASVLKNHLDWAKYINEKPPTTLCVNLNKSSPDQVVSLLRREQLPAETSHLETAVLTSSLGRYSSAVKECSAHVMDESSQLVAFFAASHGERILDYCAGNGGKSLAMASFGRNMKTIYAYDINLEKQAILEKRCQAYHANVICDQKIPPGGFDVVLVDAPCTGIGAARRNPEAKYVPGSGDFPKNQLDILREAAQKLDRNGFLMYSVCTFTPDETDQVVEAFLTLERGFRCSWFDDFVLNDLLSRTRFGAFTMVPFGDIFYLSVLQKIK